MNWSQEELEQWTLTQQQKEEDSEAIERYHAQDRNKIKELDLAVERMNHTVATRRTELEREVTDTQSAQMQLQKAADDFARLHKVHLRLTYRCVRHSQPIMGPLLWVRVAHSVPLSFSP